MRLMHRAPNAQDETDERSRGPIGIDRRRMADERAAVDDRATNRGGTTAAAADTTLTYRDGDRRADRRDGVSERGGRVEDTRGDRRDPEDRHLTRRRRVHVHRPFHVGNMLTTLAGGALAVIGVVALVRTGLDGSWDRPLTTVLDIDHTPLVAGIEVAVGAVLLLLGLSGRRSLALVGTAALAIAAAVVAIEPGRLATEYALETWWAWTIAGSAAFLALLLMLPSRRREEVSPTGQHAVPA